MASADPEQSERDPFDLQIGEIFQLFQGRGGRYSLRREIGKLRSARNSLAHVVPLSAAVAMDLVREG